jgi:cell wall-associated NlpC family hydrolase
LNRRLLLVLLVLVLAGTCVVGASAGRDPGTTPSVAERVIGRKHHDHAKAPHRAVVVRTRPTLGARAARYARRMLGVPYRYGGDSPSSGFDCSGLVRYVFGHFGLSLPHSSYADFGVGRHVGRAALRPGDLVFFDGLGHVGLYVGSGSFIHAPHSGTTVRISSLTDPWYSSRYVGARRVGRAA